MLSRGCAVQKLMKMKLLGEAGGHRRWGVIPRSRTTRGQGANECQSYFYLVLGFDAMNRGFVNSKVVKRWSRHTPT